MKKSIPDELWNSIVIAFIGEIYSNIRAIAIGYDNDSITFRYYLDREPIDFDYESLEIVATNFDACSPASIPIKNIDIECIYLKEDKMMNSDALIQVRFLTSEEGGGETKIFLGINMDVL